jgi:hypothetical protein
VTPPSADVVRDTRVVPTPSEAPADAQPVVQAAWNPVAALDGGDSLASRDTVPKDAPLSNQPTEPSNPVKPIQWLEGEMSQSAPTDLSPPLGPIVPRMPNPPNPRSPVLSPIILPTKPSAIHTIKPAADPNTEPLGYRPQPMADQTALPQNQDEPITAPWLLHPVREVVVSQVTATSAFASALAEEAAPQSSSGKKESPERLPDTSIQLATASLHGFGADAGPANVLVAEKTLRAHRTQYDSRRLFEAAVLLLGVVAILRLSSWLVAAWRSRRWRRIRQSASGCSFAEFESVPRPALHWRAANRSAVRPVCTTIVGVLVSCLFNGCAALTNPVLNGIPVRRLPTEILSSPVRERTQTIPLALLKQVGPKDYLLAAGDVIGVYVAGVFPLTQPDQPIPAPPVYFPSQIDPLGAGLPPSTGYPVTIRSDGTISLPLIEPVSLDGLTVEQANQRVREAYIDKGILPPGRETVLLTLMQPRQIRVLVFRQEVGGFSAGGRGDISSNNVKLGTGHVVDLRAYENDVATALANTGGLPGLDAFDGVFIFRGGQSNQALVQALSSLNSYDELKSMEDLGVKVDYIPTRWAAGDPVPFQPHDVILNQGDILLLESRDRDLFYAAGLLPAGQYVLPRDHDLDVVEAVVLIRGTLVNGSFGGNNFTGRLIQQGAGNPNPSALTVIRRTPDGGQIPISVDLNRALKDPRERILVQPNDVLILQETVGEAFARYVNDVFVFNAFTYIYRGSTGVGQAGVNQIPSNR